MNKTKLDVQEDILVSIPETKPKTKVKRKPATVKRNKKMSKAATLNRIKKRNAKREKLNSSWERMMEEEAKGYKRISDAIKGFTNENMDMKLKEIEEIILPELNNLPPSESTELLKRTYLKKIDMLKRVIDMSHVHTIDIEYLCDENSKVDNVKLSEMIVAYRKMLADSPASFVDPMLLFDKSYTRVDFHRYPRYVAKLFTFFSSIIPKTGATEDEAYLLDKMLLKSCRATDDILEGIKLSDNVVESSDEESSDIIDSLDKSGKIIEKVLDTNLQKVKESALTNVTGDIAKE